MERTGSTSSTTNTRHDTFTEAVPLSLSSIAHTRLPLPDGVLDGVRQVTSHTLLSCVNYARIVHPPHEWTFADVTTTRTAWRAVKATSSPSASSDVPFSLQKLKFIHVYTRDAFIYLKPALPRQKDESDEEEGDDDEDNDEELEQLLQDSNWTNQPGILGRISLLYVSKEPLTAGEMDGTDTEDMPDTILYKVVVEYRSLPATGNQQAVQAEELSMLSFGGSVDDDVKYGALASLYDALAKYVLEIYSVRGKKYKFDLMDSTLNDGTVPRLPSKCEGDAFVKCLCATVTDHSSFVHQTTKEEDDDEGDYDDENNDDAGGDDTNHRGSRQQQQQRNSNRYAITRMQLTLEGKLRQSLDTSLPRFDYMANAIKASFLQLNPEPLSMVSASPSGHTLLLDPSLAGHVYVNGRYVTSWGQDSRIGSHGVALFGMDLHSIPFWHGSIIDYTVMRAACGELWQQVLVDSRLLSWNIATRLLYRLMRGYDQDEDENDLYDDDDDARADTSVDCLESQVLTSSEYDPVGIGAKALATRFNMEFGAAAFPCLEYEVEWVKTVLPGRIPVAVPDRLLSVLRRGGHFNVQRTADELWFNPDATRPAEKGVEQETVEAALELLKRSGFDDVHPEQVVFVKLSWGTDAVAQKTVCRYNSLEAQYCVQESFMEQGMVDLLSAAKDNGADSVDNEAVKKSRAYLLGMYIAQTHRDGNVLARYLLRNREYSN